MANIYDVIISNQANKQMKKLPLNIIIKLQSWIDTVAHYGLAETRKISGFHDEPLEGKRKGQRSIRLNIAYRAIYVISYDGTINFVEILEVNKHEY